MLEAFEQALMGKKVESLLVLIPNKAYGEFSTEAIVDCQRDFEVDGKFDEL